MEPAEPVEPAERALERGVLGAVAYADVFDYPLAAAEVCRYLVGVAAPPAAVDAALARLAPGRLSCRDGWYTLPGREALVATRRRRAAAAARLWPAALRWGRALAEIPFVRMVAVTGSLALDNAEAGGDIDYLLVTEAGRVWVGRGLAAALRRAALGRGARLCPNYVLSDRSMAIRDRSLYTAHELTQMVPIAGAATYRRMREANGWTRDFLPNADGAPRRSSAPEAHPAPDAEGGRGRVSRVAEAALRTRVGAWIDRAERRRVTRKLVPRAASLAEVVYSADCCKDHRTPRGEQVLAAYARRLGAAGVPDGPAAVPAVVPAVVAPAGGEREAP